MGKLKRSGDLLKTKTNVKSVR